MLRVNLTIVQYLNHVDEDIAVVVEAVAAAVEHLNHEHRNNLADCPFAAGALEASIHLLLLLYNR